MNEEKKVFINRTPLLFSIATLFTVVFVKENDFLVLKNEIHITLYYISLFLLMLFFIISIYFYFKPLFTYNNDYIVSHRNFSNKIYYWKDVSEIWTDPILPITVVRLLKGNIYLSESIRPSYKECLKDFINLAQKNNAQIKIDNRTQSLLKKNKTKF